VSLSNPAHPIVVWLEQCRMVQRCRDTIFPLAHPLQVPTVSFREVSVRIQESNNKERN
jgi:hypothetical protein